MGNELVDSFKESISSDFREIAGETSEVILDSFLNEGLAYLISTKEVDSPSRKTQQ